MQKIQVNGTEIAYRLDGPEDAPVAMMSHALGTSHRLWDWQVPALSDRYRLLRYDWRGHGGSAVPAAPFTLDDMADDAAALLDALGIGRVHWVGISTGGMIGQGVALRHPDRLTSLALCNTMARAPDAYRDWAKERLAVLARDGVPGLWDISVDKWFSPGFIDRDPETVAAVRAIYVASPADGFAAAVRAVAALDYLDRLSAIRMPTLILAAGDDPVTAVVLSEAMQARIEGSELVVVPGTRHLSNVEAPDAFNTALRSHLDRLA